MDDTIEKGCNPRKDGLQPFFFILHYHNYLIYTFYYSISCISTLL